MCIRIALLFFLEEIPSTIYLFPFWVLWMSDQRPQLPYAVPLIWQNQKKRQRTHASVQVDTKRFNATHKTMNKKKNDKHKFVYPNIYGAQSSKRMTHSILRQSFNTVYQPRCHAMKIDSDHGDHGLPCTHLLRRSGLICLTAGGATRAPASHPSPVQQCPSFTPMSTRTMTVCVCFCLNLKNAHCWMSVSSRLCVVSAQTAPATIQFYYG